MEADRKVERLLFGGSFVLGATLFDWSSLGQRYPRVQRIFKLVSGGALENHFATWLVALCLVQFVGSQA